MLSNEGYDIIILVNANVEAFIPMEIVPKFLDEEITIYEIKQGMK